MALMHLILNSDRSGMGIEMGLARDFIFFFLFFRAKRERKEENAGCYIGYFLYACHSYRSWERGLLPTRLTALVMLASLCSGDPRIISSSGLPLAPTSSINSRREPVFRR